MLQHFILLLLIEDEELICLLSEVSESLFLHALDPLEVRRETFSLRGPRLLYKTADWLNRWEHPHRKGY